MEWLRLVLLIHMTMNSISMGVLSVARRVMSMEERFDVGEMSMARIVLPMEVGEMLMALGVMPVAVRVMSLARRVMSIPMGVSGLMSLTQSSNLLLSRGRSSLNTTNQEGSRSSHLQHSSRSLNLIRVMRLISLRMIRFNSSTHFISNMDD